MYGRWFLVDSGSQKGLIPPTDSDLGSRGSGPQLSTTNRSSIGTFSTRSATVCFYRHTFNWNLVIASNVVPIIGADFLCANDLLVDVANRHLIDAMSFATFPCQTGIWALYTC